MLEWRPARAVRCGHAGSSSGQLTNADSNANTDSNADANTDTDTDSRSLHGSDTDLRL
jgi:hypothetical protein